jgi:hypothetical protein
MDGDEEIDINLRPAAEVGRRLVVLATLCRRAFLESASDDLDPEDDPETERFDLETWLDDQGLGAEQTIWERQFLNTAVGALAEDEARAGTWNAEALVALGWAVGLIDQMPDPVGPTDPAPVLSATPAPWDDPRSWIASIELRPEETVALERERAEIWLWRAEIEDERRQLRGRALSTLESDLREVVRESAEAGLLTSPDADFPVSSRPFHTLDQETIDLVAGVAGVRLHALNWLCGFGTSWDDVPLDLD